MFVADLRVSYESYQRLHILCVLLHDAVFAPEITPCTQRRFFLTVHRSPDTNKRTCSMEHMQARHRLKQHHRARLGHLGLGFCDDNAARLQQLELLYADARGTWEAESTLYEPITSSACHASTTDNEVQNIDTTIRNDRLFWSSTGSQTQIADEALLYELRGPACQVHFLKLAVYRAFYQHGYPVYPPMQLQIWTGASPSQLQPASPVYDVQATDALQTFAVNPNAPVARFLQVRMYGKLQKQREDMQFYIAIRYISAVGSVVPAAQLSSIKSVLNTGHWVLNPGGQLPASCCAGLSNITTLGLGPTEAALGFFAAGRVLVQPEQQQRLVPVELDKLVVRRQQQLSNEQRKAQQQRRQQGRHRGSSTAGSTGFWSSLGLSRWRGQKTLGASPAGCDCHDSSGGESMQIDSSATAEASIAAVDQLHVTPKWLLPDDASQPNSRSSGSFEEMKGAATATGMVEDRNVPALLDSDSDFDTDASNGDLDEISVASAAASGAGGGGGGGHRGWAAVADAAGAAEQARMELLLWQALNRLPDPNDPVDREQLLAVWLEDEPLNSSIPPALRSQVAVAVDGSSNRQQQLPGGWMLRSRPVVVCRDCSSSSKSSGDGEQLQGTSSTQQQRWSYSGGILVLSSDLSVACQADLSASLVVQHAALSHLLQLPPSAAATAEAAAAALARGQQQAAAAGEPEIEVLQQPEQQWNAIRVSGHCLYSVDVLGGWGSSSSGCSSDWVESCSMFDEGLEQDLYLHQQLMTV